MKEDNKVKFVLHAPREALWQFRAVYNDEQGELQELVISENPSTGEKKHATFKFHAGSRMITIPKFKKDIRGNSFVEFLRNSPYCRGSKTCEGEGVFFEYNPLRDAEIANEERRLRLKAELAASELSGEELRAFAAYYGEFSDNVELQKAVVAERARVRYREFNEKLGTDEVSNTAIFNLAKKNGVIVQKGFRYETAFGKRETIGNSEEATIANIASNRELREVLETHIEEAKVK